MGRSTSFILRESDYGQELDFYLVDEDGNAYAVPDAATVTFVCYLSGASTYFISDSAHVTVVSADEGHVRYTVQSGDFDTTDAGSYYCYIKVNTITSSTEVPLTVLDVKGAPA